MKKRKATQQIKKVCLGRDLADALGKVELSSSEARVWHKDLVAARAKLFPPKDKWE